MRRVKRCVWLLMMTGFCILADVSKIQMVQGQPVEVIKKEKKKKEIPEFVITEYPFLSYRDMERGNSRSQVFTLYNEEEETQRYYLRVEQERGKSRIIIKRRGALIYDSMCKERELFIAELKPGKQAVMELTVVGESTETSSIFPHFSKQQK